jgi:anti-anti-sigma regulatory factor
MAGGTHIPVFVGRSGPVVLVRPVGAPTAAVAGPLKSFLVKLQQPSVKQIYFDLSRADCPDSTFIGLMVGLATKKMGPQTPDVQLLAPSEICAQALKRCHVLPLFTQCQTASGLPEELHQLPAEKASAEELADIIIESHEALIEADKRNIAAFGGVVDTFRKHRGDSGEA